MAVNTFMVTFNLPSFLFKPCRSSQTFLLSTSKQKDGSFSNLDTGLQRARRVERLKRDFTVYSSDQQADQIPFQPFLNSWKGWLLGLLATFILPFLTNKLRPLLKLEKNIEAAEETADKVAETVAEVAEEVEKVAEDIAEELPEGGKLRNAVTNVENMAKEVGKDASLAEDFINKVEEVEKQVDSLVEVKPGPGDSNVTAPVADDQK